MASLNNRLYSLPLSRSVPNGVVSQSMNTTHASSGSQHDALDTFINEHKRTLGTKPPHPYADQHLMTLLVQVVEALRPTRSNIDATATGSHG
jgi:hypothetical protein